jgi:hypothetical protein
MSILKNFNDALWPNIAARFQETIKKLKENRAV